MNARERVWEVDLEDEEPLVKQALGELTRQTVFHLNPEWYGIDTPLTSEVLRVPSITHLPHAPSFVHGLINLRGNIIVTVDIREFFGLERITLKKDSRVIVVKTEEKSTGILVDYVSDVLDVPLKDIQPPISTIKGSQAEYIKGEVKLPDGRFLILLNLEKVMASRQMRGILKG